MIIEFSKEELREVAAKLANELEVYKDQASDGLKSAFLKVMQTNLERNSTLIVKWKKKLTKKINL